MPLHLVPLGARASLAIGLLLPVASAQRAEPESGPNIPRTWDPERIETLHLPIAATGEPPRQVDAEYYESIPAQTIYRTYPVYHPDHEPEGYFDDLLRKEPEVVFPPDPDYRPDDWERAGSFVFDWPASRLDPVDGESRARMRDEYWDAYPLTREGVDPFSVYVVREKGKVEMGSRSCASCHTRVQPDGTTIRGAQGNFPFDQRIGRALKRQPDLPSHQMLIGLFGMPEVEGTAPPYPPDMTGAAVAEAFAAIPGGVLARHGTSVTAPVQIPDLIGVENRKYLDRTGLVRHRDIGDMMRYAALNQGLDRLSFVGDFRQATAALDAADPSELPPGMTAESIRERVLAPEEQYRLSDPQLYALARYVYSLEPPANPHPMDELARRGQQVFESEECGKCHTPPLYTNNRLVPVPGFRPSAELREQADISHRRVDTDPTLALTTRRGTGFYKVPSLKGVWYRGPFTHDGSVATLEDWFDPRRLDDDYVPTGWNPGGRPRPVPGHRFGLELSDSDREALIAFLRTL